MTDISKAAVDALLQGVTDGPWEAVAAGQADNLNEVVVFKPTFQSIADAEGANARFIAAARELVPALRAALDEAEARAADYYERWNDCQEKRQKAEAERDAAVEAKLDAISTLDAWFNRRKLGHEAVDQAIVDAASGYLRTSRVGGMPQEESDLILGVIQDMARLGLFADLFARAHLGAKP